MYYIGKGAKSWQGFTGAGTSGTSLDTACHLIKSGTDFRDLSSCTLTLSSHPSSIRRRLISSIEGKHHYVLPTSASSPEYEELIDGLMATVGKELGKPVAYTLTEFDALSENVRTKETGLGNWVADVLRHAYAESGLDAGAAPDTAERAEEGTEGEEGVQTPTAKAFLIDTTNGKKGRAEVPPRADGGADAVIICGGGLRGDSKYGPGKVTMGDILGMSAILC
jgi:2',3'-cyclic-nucleotide 2'-phosphodiesterase (5'-nucleotidase family)